MPIDYEAAENFIWSAARLVDRHRYSMLFADGPAESVIEALRGYRNPDGGFGNALEPDLRCPGSQPSPTLYALEILNEAGAADGELARDARTWIARVAGPDGVLPFVLPGFERHPHAPWYQAGPGSIGTLGLAAACHSGGVTGDQWLERATDWCWSAIEAAGEPGGYWLKYALAFLDAVPDERRARAAIEALASRVDLSAIAPAGGIEGETLRPLDLSPQPGSRSRELVSKAEIETHLDTVESDQQEDGGWQFDWLAWAPAQNTDWRGNVTIRALCWLRDNGRL
jgi:hypothetical protein